MTKRQLSAMSPAETEIYRLVWQQRRATVQDVCNHLPARRKIAYGTVQTLLRRLEKKGYLRHDVEGKAHVFYPSVPRDRVIRRSVTDFLDRLFGGDPIPLMHYLAKHGKVSPEEIEELKRVVESD
jgi:BlaI family transcriptional regulator, penicillinase repressor